MADNPLPLADRGLEFRLSASECYSPAGRYGNRPGLCPIGVLRGADGTVLPVGHGINVCNVPLGEPNYVASFLSSKADVVASNIRLIAKELADYANEAWCALFYWYSAERFEVKCPSNHSRSVLGCLRPPNVHVL